MLNYVYAITFAITARNTTTTEAKDIKVKLSGNVQGDVELNQNLLMCMQVVKGHISNIPGTAQGIKLKLSGHVKGDVKLTRIHYVHTTITNTTGTITTMTASSTTITTESKGIKVKF